MIEVLTLGPCISPTHLRSPHQISLVKCPCAFRLCRLTQSLPHEFCFGLGRGIYPANFRRTNSSSDFRHVDWHFDYASSHQTCGASLKAMLPTVLPAISFRALLDSYASPAVRAQTSFANTVAGFVFSPFVANINGVENCLGNFFRDSLGILFRIPACLQRAAFGGYNLALCMVFARITSDFHRVLLICVVFAAFRR